MTVLTIVAVFLLCGVLPVLSQQSQGHGKSLFDATFLSKNTKPLIMNNNGIRLLINAKHRKRRLYLITETIAIDCDSPYNTESVVPGTTIISPNHPNLYENNQECSITIRYPQEQNVALEFLAFDIETAIDCNYDHLTIYDGATSNSRLIGSKLCGNTLPGLVNSTGNTMHIRFHTDSSQIRSGFKIVANGKST